MSELPSCSYHVDLPCDKPKKCPVHSHIVARPSKRTHFLQVELEGFSWRKETPYWRTLCGEFMHMRFLPSNLIPSGTGRDVLRKYFDEQERLELAGWKGVRAPSTDPNYEVFIKVGTSSSEVLVTTTDVATCTRCAASKKSHREPMRVYDREDML